MRRILHHFCFWLAAFAAGSLAHAAPDHVDITWMSITNMHFDLGNQQILADGYITRLPQEIFYGGGGGFASTRRAMQPDAAAVREVFDAIGGKAAVKLLLTGHSHWDHSFDTATWAKLYGGEKFTLARGVEMYVIRWNHSGDPAQNPEQHDPVELRAAPVPDAAGALRAGVAEDFPNGGGNRAYLFKVDGPAGRFSWLFQDSASAVDLRQAIVVNGSDYGAPLDNLRAAMKAAGLDSVDLWIATGGREVAELVLPVLKPKAYLPVHWDGLFGAFKTGPARPYADAALESLLTQAGVQRVVPMQYMDRWRLDRNGIRALDNDTVKRKLGFN